MKKLGLIVLVLVFLWSCASVPTREQINSADCGPFPHGHEEAIKTIISPFLYDPYSAVFTFILPQKGWNNMGNEPIYGWFLCGTVNAKNRFGGWAGAKPFYAMIVNGTVVRLIHEGITIPDSVSLGMLSGNRGFYDGICGVRLLP